MNVAQTRASRGQTATIFPGRCTLCDGSCNLLICLRVSRAQLVTIEACEVCKTSLEADDFRAEPELTWPPFFAVNYVVMNRGEQGGKLHQYTPPGTSMISDKKWTFRRMTGKAIHTRGGAHSPNTAVINFNSKRRFRV